MRGGDLRAPVILWASALLLSTKVVGGPSTPLPTAPPSKVASVPTGSQTELSEAAPFVSEIKVQTEGDNIEVFVKGWRPSSCHKSQEVLVTQETEVTRVVVRMQRSKPAANQVCSTTNLEPLNIKVADLLKTQKSSYKILVLGHKGWHELDLAHLMPTGL